MVVRPLLLTAGLLALTACSRGDLARNDQGRLQPQTVSGPCDVKKFFLVPLTTMPTTMSVAPGGQCSLTLINPDLQIFNTAALVTTPPSHGQATATLLRSGTQVGVSYIPQPGYTGPDKFAITIESGDRGVTFAVTVAPQS